MKIQKIQIVLKRVLRYQYLTVYKKFQVFTVYKDANLLLIQNKFHIGNPELKEVLSIKIVD